MVEICVPSGFKELLERMMHAILWNRPLRLNRFILAFLEAELDKRTLCELTINASTYDPPLSPQKVASSKQLIDAIVSSASSEGFSEGFELKQRISISNATYGKQQIVQRVGIWATAGARVTRDVGTATEERRKEKPVQVSKAKNASSQTERAKKSTKSVKSQSPNLKGTLVKKSMCREVGTTTEGLQIVTNRSAVSVKKEEIINGVNYRTSSAIQSSITIAPIRSAHSAKRDAATDTASMKVSAFKDGACRDAGTEIDFNITGTTSDSTLSNQKSGRAATFISTTFRTQEMKSVSSQTGESVTRMGPKVKSVLSGSGHVLTDLLPMATSDVMISTEDPPLTALYVDSAIMTDLPAEVVSVTESRSTVQVHEGSATSIKQTTTETIRMPTGDTTDYGRQIVKQVSTETVIEATKVPSGDTAIVAKATQDATTETGAMSPEGVELVSVMIDIRARATPDFLRRKDDDPFIKSGLEARRHVTETEHGATIALQVGVATPGETPRDGASPTTRKPSSAASSKAPTYESKAKSGDKSAIAEGTINIAKESAESVKDISGATENEAGTELPIDSATGSEKVVRTASKTELRDVSTETDQMFNTDNRQQISASSEPTVKTKTITELNLTEIQRKRESGSISEHESLQTSSKSSSKSEGLPKVTPPNFYEDEEPTLFKSRIDPAITAYLDERGSSESSMKADEVTGEVSSKHDGEESSKHEGEEPKTTSTSQARIEDILKVDNATEIFAMVHDKTAVVDTDKSTTDKEASESRPASECQPSTEAVVDAEMSKSHSITAAKEASQPGTEQPIDPSEHQQSIEAIKDATADNSNVESITAAKEASEPGTEQLIDPSEHKQSIDAIKDATADNSNVESITAAKEASEPGTEQLIDPSEHKQSIDAIKDATADNSNVESNSPTAAKEASEPGTEQPIDPSEHKQSIDAIKDATADNSNVESLSAAKEGSEPPLSTEAVVDGDKSPVDVSKSHSVSAAKEASESRLPSEYQPPTEAVVDATADNSNADTPNAAKEASEPGAPSEPRLSVAEGADADSSGSEKSDPLSAAKDASAVIPPLVPGEPRKSSAESASDSSNTISANAAKDLASPKTIIEPQVSTQGGADADSKSEKPINNDEDLIALDSVPREMQARAVTVVDKRTQSQLATETPQVEALSDGGTSAFEFSTTPSGTEGQATSSDVGYESQEPAGSAAREVKPIETSEIESTGSEADSEAPIRADSSRYMTPTPVLPLEGIENAMAPPESTTEMSSEPTDSDIV